MKLSLSIADMTSLRDWRIDLWACIGCPKTRTKLFMAAVAKQETQDAITLNKDLPLRRNVTSERTFLIKNNLLKFSWCEKPVQANKAEKEVKRYYILLYMKIIFACCRYIHDLILCLDYWSSDSYNFNSQTCLHCF